MWAHASWVTSLHRHSLSLRKSHGKSRLTLPVALPPALAVAGALQQQGHGVELGGRQGFTAPSSVFSHCRAFWIRILAKKMSYWSHAWQERLSDLQKIKLRDVLAQQLTVPTDPRDLLQAVSHQRTLMLSPAEQNSGQHRNNRPLSQEAQSWKRTFASCQTQISFCKQLLEHDLLFASHDTDYKAGFFWYWAVHLWTKPPIKLFA